MATTSAPPVFPFPREAKWPFNPSPDYARLREEQPVSLVQTPEGNEAWLCGLRYEDVVKVLSDPKTFSANKNTPGYPTKIVGASLVLGQVGNMVEMDPPAHTRLRNVINQGLTIRRVNAIHPLIQQATDETIDDFMADGPPADLVQNAYKIATKVLMALLGVRYEDHEIFHRGVALCFQTQSTDPAVMQAANDEMNEYLTALIAEKQANPGEDTISDIVREALDPGVISFEECLALVRLLVTAGFETTGNTMALGTLLLLEHPSQLAELRADASLWPNAVEEILRVTSITHQGRRRATTADTEIAGCPIHAGQGVIVSNEAANRDPTVFENPNEFDIRRANARRHLGFSIGNHTCAGSGLARAELQIVFETLFRRIPALELAVPFEEVTFRTDGIALGLDSLPLTW
jgi:cytochrome P450